MTNYLKTLRLFSRNLHLFLVANVLFGFAYFGIYALLFNLYLLRLGYGPKFIGLINASGPLVMALGSLPAGALSQRWGSRRTLIAGFGLNLLALCLLPLAEFLPTRLVAGSLLAAYVVAWAGITLFVVNIGPFMMGATREPERNHAFAVLTAIRTVAGFAGSLIGGLLPGFFAALLGVALDQPGPYRYPLWLAAVLYLPAVLAMYAADEVKIEPVAEAVTAATAAPYGLMLMIALVFLLRMAGLWIVNIFFNIYLDAGLHVSTALIGGLSAVGQLLGVVALAAPFFIGRWGNARTIGWGLIGMAGSLVPLALFVQWLAAGVGFIAISAIGSLSGPAFDIFSQELIPPHWRTTMSGAITTALGVSIAAVAFGGGYLIVAAGYQMLFLLGIGLEIAAALLFFVYFRKWRGGSAQVFISDKVEAG